MQQRVSIALATYNGASYISAQLDSLVGQTRRPYEIIVCDDGSTDDTRATVARYAAHSPVPIQLVTNEKQLGWRANFMKAASLCEGELIAFCDQDDVWEPEKLEFVVSHFVDADTLLVYHNAQVVDTDLKRIGDLSALGPEREISQRMTLSPWLGLLGFTMVFNRALLEFWPLWENSIDKYAQGQRAAHDQWVLFLASALGTTRYLGQELVRYRQHGGNAMGIAVSSSRRAWLSSVMHFGETVDLRLRVLDSRVAVLEHIVAHSERWAAPAAQAMETYRRMVTLLRDQSRVYGSRAIGTRIGALGRLLMQRAYSGSPWELSRGMAIKDSIVTLIGPQGLSLAQRLLAG